MQTIILIMASKSFGCHLVEIQNVKSIGGNVQLVFNPKNFVSTKSVTALKHSWPFFCGLDCTGMPYTHQTSLIETRLHILTSTGILRGIESYTYTLMGLFAWTRPCILHSHGHSRIDYSIHFKHSLSFLNHSH